MSLFNKHNFNIADFCAKNSARPELEGIFVEPNRTTATDSFVLASVSTPKGQKVEDYPEIPNKPKPKTNFQPFILPQAEASKMAKILQQKNINLPDILENAVVLQSDNEMVEIGATDLQSFNGVYTRIVKGEYPKFQDILEEQGKHLEILVNPKLLLKIAKFFGSFEDMVKVRIPLDKEKPVRFCQESKDKSQTATALLMPIKSE